MDRGVAKRLTGRGASFGPQPRVGQDGAVLFLGLALLLAITAGVLSAAQTTSLELRMSRNSHDAALALRAADAALAEAEVWLESSGDPANARVYSGGTRYGEVVAWRDPTIWTAHGRTAGTPLPGLVEPPRYLIEWVTTYESPPGNYVDVFRVTVTGVGSNQATAVRLQATYARARSGAGIRRLSWVELGS